MTTHKKKAFIERRRSYILGCATKVWREGHIFEHFMIVGLPSNYPITPDQIHTPKNPEILYYFPENRKVEIEGIASFCFPSGVETRLVPKTRSASELKSLVFGSLSQLESTENSFIFLITDERLLYGTCVLVNEVLEEPCSLLGTAPTPTESVAKGHRQGDIVTTTKSKNVVVTKRCYCILSRFPFFSLHFEVLYSFLAKDRLHRLTQVTDANFDPQTAAKELKELLNSYYHQPVPKAGASLSFQLPGEIRSLEFHIPTVDDETSLNDWCIACTFRLLPLDTIVALFSAVMMEHRILLVCRNLGILSAIALSLLPMLRPFVWQGVFIPILPNSMLDVLDAPVPCVLGILSVPEDRLNSLHDFMIVNIDQNTISLPKGFFGDIPHKRSLTAKLKVFHDQLYLLQRKEGYKMVNPCRCTEEELNTMHQIFSVFRDYHRQNIDMIANLILKHHLTLSNETFESDLETIVRNMPKQYRTWGRLFFHTQHFVFYTTKLMNTLIRRQEDDRALLQTLKLLIDTETNEVQKFEVMLKNSNQSEGTTNNDLEKLKNAQQDAQKRVSHLKKTLKKLLKENPYLKEDYQKSLVAVTQSSANSTEIPKKNPNACIPLLNTSSVHNNNSTNLEEVTTSFQSEVNSQNISAGQQRDHSTSTIHNERPTATVTSANFNSLNRSHSSSKKPHSKKKTRPEKQVNPATGNKSESIDNNKQSCHGERKTKHEGDKQENDSSPRRNPSTSSATHQQIRSHQETNRFSKKRMDRLPKETTKTRGRSNSSTENHIKLTSKKAQKSNSSENLRK
jgi:hypothetical protein